MDTISHIGLVSLSTIKTRVNYFYPLLVHAYPTLSVLPSSAYPVSTEQTVLTNMLCYTSHCTSNTLGTSPIFFCWYTVFLFPLYPP